MKKTAIALLLTIFLLAFSVSMALADRSSIAYGVECLMTQDEQSASSDICAAIQYFFGQTGQYDYVQNYYGSGTQPGTVYSEAEGANSNFDFATVFYKGHSLWDDSYYPWQFYLYDNDGNAYWDVNDRIIDYYIAQSTYNGVHDFVFLWTCGMALTFGYVNPPVAYGMGACWLFMNDVASDHCYISFYSASPEFVQETGYSSHTVGEFVGSFYQYVTDGDYTLGESLEYAASYSFGSSFENTWLCTGFWYESSWSYICAWGDGNMMLVN